MAASREAAPPTMAPKSAEAELRRLGSMCTVASTTCRHAKSAAPGRHFSTGVSSAIREIGCIRRREAALLHPVRRLSSPPQRLRSLRDQGGLFGIDALARVLMGALDPEPGDVERWKEDQRQKRRDRQAAHDRV